MVKVIHILFEPMYLDGEFDPVNYDAVAKATKVGEIALEHKLYKSPAHSVFLIRALIGLEGIIRGLGVRANYREIFRECVERARRLAAAPAGCGDRLERHRDHHFRRVPSRRVRGEQSALAFINEVGFCSGFTAGLGVPCLREAIAGEREPGMPDHIQHDYAIGMTWRIKDSLPARRAVYYGKVIAGRPGFIARDMIGAFLRLRIAPGGYRRMYARGDAVQLREAGDGHARRGAAPAETRVLKLSSGYAQASRRAEFDRAMKELQEKFLALKVEEHYDPFYLRVGHDGASMARRDRRGALALAGRRRRLESCAATSRSPRSATSARSRACSGSIARWSTRRRDASSASA